ncbi:VOC family protein [uncultured Limimaricola sp.]|uniref:VOC family protein n=1 Tax=uncultured Limimaricola sp. TaxID=2211667 RepID=UPI0030F4FDD5
MTPEKQRICLWFYTQGEEAAQFYISLLPDSRIDRVRRSEVDQHASVVEFTLGGIGYVALNAGPHLRLTEAVPISVLANDQAEVDRLWSALVSQGGEGGRCGWLRDRFGLSWQILPRAVPRLLAEADRDAAGRVAQAFMEMGKVDIAGLEAAFADDARDRSTADEPAPWEGPTED